MLDILLTAPRLIDLVAAALFGYGLVGIATGLVVLMRHIFGAATAPDIVTFPLGLLSLGVACGLKLLQARQAQAEAGD